MQGAVEEASEVLLLIKTRVEKLGALEAAVRRLHSYDVPEFVILKVDGGSGAYLKWLDESLRIALDKFVILKVTHACALRGFRTEHCLRSSGRSFLWPATYAGTKHSGSSTWRLQK